MADGLIALPLSVKGYRLLPQGVGVSCAAWHNLKHKKKRLNILLFTAFDVTM